MDKNRVLEALHTLHAELADADDLDGDARQALDQVTGDIQRLLASGSATRVEGESLAGRVRDAWLGIEAEHPRLTGAVNQLANALATLGI